MRFEVSDLLSGVIKYWFSVTSQLVLGRIAAKDKQEPPTALISQRGHPKLASQS